MSERRPDFDELVGSDLDPSERERLLRVHDALLTAGPPPDLPEHLATAPVVGARVVPFVPRRRRIVLVGVAAAVAVAIFAGGVSIGHHRAMPAPVAVVAMTGTPLASRANASLDLFPVDSAGNWPMRLSVSGLPPSANGRPYELWLTRHGKVIALCGSFVPQVDGTTVVSMNAPYRLKEYDGWVVVLEGAQTPVLTTA